MWVDKAFASKGLDWTHGGKLETGARYVEWWSGVGSPASGSYGFRMGAGLGSGLGLGSGREARDWGKVHGVGVGV